jgi:carboxypeptidase family protein
MAGTLVIASRSSCRLTIAEADKAPLLTLAALAQSGVLCSLALGVRRLPAHTQVKHTLSVIVVLLTCTVGSRAHAQRTSSLCAPSGRGEVPDARMWNDSLNQSARPADLVGRVISVTGAPVLHATIKLQRRLNGDSTDRIVRVDSTGAFRFADIPPATYILHVRAIGFGEQWQAIDLRAAGRDSVCVRLRPKGAELVPSSPANRDP